MNFMKNNIRGLLLCIVIAIPSWFLAELFPLVGGPVFGMLFGILIAYIIKKREKLDPGIRFTSKKILQYSIILLGFGMNFYNILQVGARSIYVLIFTLSAAFITAYIVGRALRVEGKLSTLIGVGTSICGGSAIAATAPVIQAKDEDIAHSISTIFLFNILAVLIFPSLGQIINMSDLGFGMWAGTAINDTSSVVSAGVSWSAMSGNDTALTFATIVKLTRTLMIIPITFVLAIYTSKKIKNESNDNNFNFIKVFPWFIIFFIFAAILNTLLPIPEALSDSLVALGKFMIVIAMSAIGLNTNLKRLISNGFQPIFLGLCCWFAVSIVSLIVQYFMNKL